MSTDAERRLETIRHEWGYVRRYLTDEHGGPTLKIHRARLEGALAAAEPERPADYANEPEPGTELYRPSRILPAGYTVSDHPDVAAELLARAASVLNELARRGAFTGGELTTETARWFTDYDRLARR